MISPLSGHCGFTCLSITSSPMCCLTWFSTKTNLPDMFSFSTTLIFWSPAVHIPARNYCLSNARFPSPSSSSWLWLSSIIQETWLTGGPCSSSSQIITSGSLCHFHRTSTDRLYSIYPLSSHRCDYTIIGHLYDDIQMAILTTGWAVTVGLLFSAVTATVADWQIHEVRIDIASNQGFLNSHGFSFLPIPPNFRFSWFSTTHSHLIVFWSLILLSFIIVWHIREAIESQ